MAGPSKLTRWQHRVREHESLTPTERAVAFVLSTYMNKDTLKAYPSFETLAAGAGCSRDTVKRAVKVLEADGMLWRKPGQYTGTASVYTGRLSGEGGTQSKRGGHSEQKRGARVHPQHGGTCENTPGASRSVGALPLPALAPAFQRESWAQPVEGAEQRAERRAQLVAELEREPHGPYVPLQDAYLTALDAFDTPAFDAALSRYAEEWELATHITTTKED